MIILALLLALMWLSVAHHVMWIAIVTAFYFGYNVGISKRWHQSFGIMDAERWLLKRLMRFEREKDDKQ
jgi:hypothetical protein